MIGITRATARTLEDWIKLYEKKTGDKAILPKGFRLYFLPERGFAQYKIDKEGEILIIYQLCGDAKFWHDLGEIICWQNNLKCISSICTRNIYAYMRFWQWSIIEQFDVSAQKRFICQDRQGRKVVITHKAFDDDGSVVYWVTHYMRERCDTYGEKGEQ